MSDGRRTLVAGLDSSTQSTKVVVCDADTGEVLRQGSAIHPNRTEVHPDCWWEAFAEATTGGLLEDVQAIAVAGQQHGMITLDDEGEVVRPAVLWNDTRSASAAHDLVEELGGPGAWALAVGSVPVASFTITKLRWLAQNEPKLADRVQEVLLPHDWLTARIKGGGSLKPGTAVTDRGDASGTGYWSPLTDQYRTDLLKLAFGRLVETPTVLRPNEAAGETAGGMLVAVGTGDNMAAALGLGLKPGDAVLSLGTSGTVFSLHTAPTMDVTGAVAGFADATGRFLPLVCTLNAARVLTATAAMLGTDLPGLDRLALGAEPGAGGLVLLPYLDGERTPNLPAATGTLGGLTRTNATPQNLARAAVEGMLCGLADGMDALKSQGIHTRRVLLIGGAARSHAVQEIASSIFDEPVTVPVHLEYAAIGAARQAAWALRSRFGRQDLPQWASHTATVRRLGDQATGERVRTAYRQLRETLYAVSV